MFTRASLHGAITEAGYVIERCEPIGPPFEAVVGGVVGRLLGTLSAGLAKLWPTMFAFQFLVVARPRPGVRQILMQSRVVQRGTVPIHMLAATAET